MILCNHVKTPFFPPFHPLVLATFDVSCLNQLSLRCLPVIFWLITLSNSGLAARHLRDECWLGRKSYFIQEASKLGRRWAHVHQLQRFCLNMKVFKGRIIWGRGQSCYLPLCADFLWLVGGKRAVLQESCAQPEVTILHLGGGLSSYRRTQRYCYVYSLRRNQDPAPRLHYCFLTSPPLSLHPLPSLISNCLNLPFKTRGRC